MANDFLKDLTGVRFLEKIAEFERACATLTEKQLPAMGLKGRECYEVLGMTVALLDSAAACAWGCARGDHRMEYLYGPHTSSAYAALCLARNGYYDQALSFARTLGEVANLLTLFAIDK